MISSNEIEILLACKRNHHLGLNIQQYNLKLFIHVQYPKYRHPKYCTTIYDFQRFGVTKAYDTCTNIQIVNNWNDIIKTMAQKCQLSGQFTWVRVIMMISKNVFSICRKEFFSAERRNRPFVDRSFRSSYFYHFLFK